MQIYTRKNILKTMFPFTPTQREVERLCNRNYPTPVTDRRKEMLKEWSNKGLCLFSLTRLEIIIASYSSFIFLDRGNFFLHIAIVAGKEAQHSSRYIRNNTSANLYGFLIPLKFNGRLYLTESPKFM